MERVAISLTDAGSVQARYALGEYFEELAQRFPEGFDAGNALDDAAQTFNPPAGLFVLAGSPDAPLGCGGVQFLDDRRGEIKRMWVAPVARGQGIATQLLSYLENLIVESGRVTAVLDTNSVLTEAIALYQRRGYRPVERYNDNPHAHVWFAKSLRAQRPIPPA